MDVAYRAGELGFTPQKPQVRAAKRDEAAIAAWKAKRLPGLKKWAQMHGFSLAYEDESGISEKPVVRKTWSMKGQTPVIESGGSWKSLTMAGVLLFTPRGRNPRILFRLQPGSMDKKDFIDLLRNIKRELKGKKLLLIWDGLPAHRAKEVTAYIKTQRSWLRVERYPAYAPELSPVEFIWSPMKAKD